MTFARLLPALASPPVGSNLRGDVFGAVAGVLSSVPISIGFGVVAVAGLGPQWAAAGAMAALFATAFAGLWVAILGSQPLLLSGPRASTALVFAMLLAQLLALPGIGSAEALAHVGLAIFLAALIQILAGVLRFGRMVEFVPYPVVSGVINGAALLIVLAQLRPLLGLPAGGSGRELIADLPQVQPAAALLGLVTALIVARGERFFRPLPSLLVGLVVGTGLFHLAAALGVPAGGTLPALPAASAFGLVEPERVLAAMLRLDGDAALLVIPAALSLAVLTFLDTILGLATLDSLLPGRSNPNRQLVVQGMANGIGGLFGFIPGAGGLVRSSPIHRAGGRTALATILAALGILAVALGFGRFIEFLPLPVLAGMLLVVGIQMIDPWFVRVLGRTRWRDPGLLPLADLLAATTVILAAAFFGLVAAVGVGVAVSLLFFVLRMARSPVRRCYRADALAARIHGDPERLRFYRRHGASIAVVELEGALFFGSIAALRREIDELLGAGICHLVLDLKRVRELDATAARMFEGLVATMASRQGGVMIAYVEPEGSLWRMLEQAGSLDVLPREWLHPDLDGALAGAEKQLASRLAACGALLAPGPRPCPMILRDIDGERIRVLRRYLECRRFAAGQAVFAQGDPPDSAYFIAGGRIEIAIDLPGTTRKMHLQTFAGGSIFGEMALIDPQPRSANAVAITRCRCYRLPVAGFVRLKREQPELAVRLLENTAAVFAERLRATNAMIAELEA